MSVAQQIADTVKRATAPFQYVLSKMIDFGQLDFGQFDFGQLAKIELAEVELAEVEHLPDVDGPYQWNGFFLNVHCVCATFLGHALLLCHELWPQSQLMMGFGASGASHDSPRTPNVHISGPRRFKHHQNPTKDPKKRRKENCGGRRKNKARNFGPPPFRTPPFKAPHNVVPKFNI